MKLIEGYVETMKYSYSGLAGSTFIFLTCITIGDQRYWKYNAEHRCFSEWQISVIIFAFVYTVPFAVTTMFGIKLLQKRKDWVQTLHGGDRFALTVFCDLADLLCTRTGND